MEYIKNSTIEKLYESENYLVVNKPYDMYINSDDPCQKNTLISHIAMADSHTRSSSHPLHFSHRLDYATSGAICIAKNKMAAAAAGKLFERRATRKYYIAVLRGNIEYLSADIEYPIGEDVSCTDGSNRMCASVSADDARCAHARPASTRLLVLERGSYGGDDATIVLLKPTTGTAFAVRLQRCVTVAGRRHQLRVHCAVVSHTIVGDYTYSDRTDVQPHRMFLHAIRLVLPLQKEPIDIETSEPFFTDGRFTDLWVSEEIVYSLKSLEDRIAMYERVDSKEFRDDCRVFKP